MWIRRWRFARERLIETKLTAGRERCRVGLRLAYLKMLEMVDKSATGEIGILDAEHLINLGMGLDGVNKRV